MYEQTIDQGDYGKRKPGMAREKPDPDVTRVYRVAVEEHQGRKYAVLVRRGEAEKVEELKAGFLGWGTNEFVVQMVNFRSSGRS